MIRTGRVAPATPLTRPPGSLRRLAALLAAGAIAVAALSFVPAVSAAPTTCGTDNPSTPAVEAGTCHVTIDGLDFVSQGALTNFTYVINVNNSKLPGDPLALSTESNSPIAREGDQGRKTVTLPDGRYLVSVRSLGHKMWGAYFTLPNDADNSGNLTLHIALTTQTEANPLPLGKIRVFVFNDNTWTNGAPDTEEGGLGNFQVGLEEQTASEVTVDYNNVPLCGGVCKTSSAAADLGFVEINNLGPATYFIDVQPPDGPCNSDPNSRWFQTTTIDGGLQLLASVEEGADGTGSPGEQLWEPPNIRTAYWFGFVCGPQPFANTSGTGEIVGTARNWVEWAPYTFGTVDEPVEQPLVALSDTTTDQTVFVGRGDAAGNFDIQNVPAGSYNLAIWDEQLSYIIRFKSITVAAGQTVDANETLDDGSTGVGVSRWFGWLDGTVYKDNNNNGKYDEGVDTPLPNTDVDQRWRDGSIKEATFTDTSGYYVYPTAEGGALGRWIIDEQGFARFSATPGASVHDEITDAVTPSCAVAPPALPANPCVPNAEGGGLLMNEHLLEGHRTTIDWGKRDYAPDKPGQIVGITYFSTTRNEFDARFQAHEDYEPAIPDMTVLLEGLGPDGEPNTDDDVIVNKYVTDHWQQPNASEDPQEGGNTFTQDCSPLLDYAGNDITSQFAPRIGPDCLEVPLGGAKTRDGKFDGGYAFADYCPESTGGYNMAADDGTCVDGSDPVDLEAGNYLVHALMDKDPTDTRACNPANTDGFKYVSDAVGSIPGGGQGCLYRPVREEDVNVDLGNQFAPQIPPPPCVGDSHTIEQATLVTRSGLFTGDQSTSSSAPLCDKKLVVIENGQNFNADFNLMTNFRTDPNGEDAGDIRTGDVAEPGRAVGQVFNDIYFERNLASNWYGEPSPIAGIPVGIYARVDTVPNTSCPAGYTAAGKPVQPDRCFDANRWRLITTLTTSQDGSFETMLPSTETLNCPIPQGPCPGMYLAIVDDPGTPGHANANYNPNLLTATTPFEIWPGLTNQLDLPLDPISGTACELNAGGTTPDPLNPAQPEILQVSRPYVLAGDSGTTRRITIFGDFIGATGTATNATGVRATLTDARNGQVETLTRANGGIVSWTPGSGSTPDTIVIQVPALASNAAANLLPNNTFRPGPKQLAIITANNNPAGGGQSSINGLTLHVMGSNGTAANVIAYSPPIVNVAAPPPGGTGSLQASIDTAAAGSLVVLSPGTYNENVLVWKPLKIQGLGPGGIIGAHELQGRDPDDPRFNVKGTVIDGRFHQSNLTAFNAEVTAHGPFALASAPFDTTVLNGADITLVAQTAAAYNISGATGIFNAARIDGLGMENGSGQGAGGVQAMANINNLQITNDVLLNNGGVISGGIGIGQQYARNSHNYGVRMANDRLMGNGGLTTSGGIGIFYDSNNYEIASSILCSNFSVNYGAGLAHIGLSPGGNIHDNQIYYNDAVDSGGGIAILGELPVGGGLSTGTGAVNVDRNLVQANTSGDDGGGLFILDGRTAELNIRNNLIVNNVAADFGGAVSLDDASNVRFVNNTVANNQTTGSAEDSQANVPRAAGIASEENDPLFQATLPASAPHFSNPVALFNNIFWNNEALTLDQFGPGATLTSQGFIDFEIHDPTNGSQVFSNARYNLFTNGNVEQADGSFATMPGGGAPITGFPTNVANRGNIVGIAPAFVAETLNELTLTGSRADPQTVTVTINTADPPTGLPGDYHLVTTLVSNLTSSAVDRGVRCSNTPVPPPSNPLAACATGGIVAPSDDIDHQARPQLRSTRVRTPWDLGADEVPTLTGLGAGFAGAGAAPAPGGGR